MAPALDVGFPVSALLVSDGNIHDFQPELVRTEEKIKVAEGVKIAKVRTIGIEAKVVLPPHRLRPTERVLDMLPEQPGKNESEAFIGTKIRELHGFFVHRIDEANPISKVGFPRSKDLHEFRQVLRRNGQIGIEDHDDVASGTPECFNDGVAFSFARLAKLHNTTVGKFFWQGQDPIPCGILGVSLDKNQLCLLSKARSSFQHIGDVSGLVAGGNDDRYHIGIEAAEVGAPGYEEDGEAGPIREWSQPPVEQTRNDRHGNRKQNAPEGFENLPVGERAEIDDIPPGEPTPERHFAREAKRAARAAKAAAREAKRAAAAAAEAAPAPAPAPAAAPAAAAAKGSKKRPAAAEGAAAAAAAGAGAGGHAEQRKQKAARRE